MVENKKMKHYKEQLSAYLHHELPKEERQLIAEHLLQCEDCRKEHDEIKLAVSLAINLPQTDAPKSVWEEISGKLDDTQKPPLSLITIGSFFNTKGLIAVCAGLLAAIGLLGVFYFSFLQKASNEIAKADNPANYNQPVYANENANVETPQVTPATNVNKTNLNANLQPISNSNINNQSASSNSNIQILPVPSNSNVKTVPVNPVETAAVQPWKVEAIAGKTVSELAVGETLVTDANSRARLQVANIGQVEVAPNSRVKLLKTNEKEHRLSLETGILKAKIDAPPRLFIVDTPTAVAVDLGCEYTLEVDKSGNSKLQVTSGFVALERGGRESIVPAGAICLTKKGKGIGTPFFDDVSENFRKNLWQIDFENGGNVEKIIAEARNYDTLTLWHLLPRVKPVDREKVFNSLVSFVNLPKGVNKEGVLKLDKKMLSVWKKEIEPLWFEQ